jgi:uncharacterized membrane protein YccC
MDFFTLLIVVGVLSVVGSVLWWIAVIWIAVNAAKSVASRLDTQFADINRLIAQAAAAQGNQRTGITRQIQGQWFAAQNQMRALDGLRRQQYEVRESEIRSMAASNGIFL